MSVFSPSLRKSSLAGREERAVRMEFGLSFRKKKKIEFCGEKKTETLKGQYQHLGDMAL